MPYMVDQTFLNLELAFRNAGASYNAFSLTDAELSNAIEKTKLVLAFLEAIGPTYSLARTPMRLRLNELEGFAEARKTSQR